ncbi:hypothetical protein [Streptomyces sp. Ag82_O1-15]|uniref:hypothetical protein n=1 Tax=Streptomyces sp. Ag82_O1-15 TaxID=1938855 RepID=UPI001C530037|nr:hypothetical protein [Streptomyces sp. Ag82_O1-15]
MQLTLYNFSSHYGTQYNLHFMNIPLITIPPPLMFLFFNRQIAAGIASGAIKGYLRQPASAASQRAATRDTAAGSPPLAGR